ncbi:hypothetical protein BB560_003132 [Smittium megazygosporum]|uniref:Protein kinase domain-containing protein n=1 Tax=Smittium megazygosporum TaxID=133381 RepID=A0A2T9ZCZ5_9FUNG|nr:hypothetical protein BB560_003132 [Smittium megazygosporum]
MGAHNTYSKSKKNEKPKGLMVGHSIDNGALLFTHFVGVGSYGEVYKAYDRISNREYAIKVLQRKQNFFLSNMENEPYIDARVLSTEIRLHSKIPPHPNVISLERILHTNDQIFMVMENCGGGDLYENISKNPYFNLSGNDALIRRLFLQLVDAVEHCHMNGVYHRDLKPENILVTEDGLNLKLIDFGLSTDRPWSNEIGCGSAYYMSPEIQGGLDGKLTHYSTAPNDVWALGIILINLATGRNPWNRAHVSDPLFCKYINDQSFLFQAINASPHLSLIIHRALDINPVTRCTLHELHDLVKGCSQFIVPKKFIPLAINSKHKPSQERKQVQSHGTFNSTSNTHFAQNTPGEHDSSVVFTENAKLFENFNNQHNPVVNGSSEKTYTSECGFDMESPTNFEASYNMLSKDKKNTGPAFNSTLKPLSNLKNSYLDNFNVLCNKRQMMS